MPPAPITLDPQLPARRIGLAYSPDDVGATVYDALGIDPESELRDRQDRPVQLNRGRIIQSLYTGA